MAKLKFKIRHFYTYIVAFVASFFGAELMAQENGSANGDENAAKEEASGQLSAGAIAAAVAAAAAIAAVGGDGSSSDPTPVPTIPPPTTAAPTQPPTTAAPTPPPTIVEEYEIVVENTVEEAVTATRYVDAEGNPTAAATRTGTATRTTTTTYTATSTDPADDYRGEAYATFIETNNGVGLYTVQLEDDTSVEEYEVVVDNDIEEYETGETVEVPVSDGSPVTSTATATRTADGS
jgi:hypothetical protein